MALKAAQSLNHQQVMLNNTKKIADKFMNVRQQWKK